MKRLLLLWCVSLLVACAAQKSATRSAAESQAAPAPPPAESAAPVSEPGTATGTGAAGADGDKAAAPTKPAAKAPAPAAAGGAGGMVVMPEQVAKAQAQFDDANKAFAASGSDCASLCKSLGSMTNATEHLCSLTEGTTDESRCKDARARLAAAQAKVKSTCTCG